MWCGVYLQAFSLYNVPLQSLLGAHSDSENPDSEMEPTRISSHSSVDKGFDDQRIEHQQRAPRLTPMEKQLEMQKALAIDPGVGRWSWAAIQVRQRYPHCAAAVAGSSRNLLTTSQSSPRCIWSPWLCAAVPAIVDLMERYVWKL